MVEIKQSIVDLLNTCGDIRFDEPLNQYTTFKTGGTADIFITPNSIAALREIQKIAVSHSIPVTIIGGGSNVLISDKGIRGIIVRICEDSPNGSNIYHEDTVIYADSSIQKDHFITYSLMEGFEGMEFMSGIPGTIGGGIVMNGGTGDGCFNDILTRIIIVDREGVIKTIDVTEDMYSYRHFSFPEGAIIVGGYFNLKLSENQNIVKEKVEAFKNDRKVKHPLEYPSAGSVFKNPEGHSSWKLINDAGLKGKSIGGAQVSEKHTNFIINTGTATSQNIKDLINLVQDNVYNTFNISLKPEVRMLGEF